MSDLIATVSLSMMFVVAVLYVRSCDHLKGAR
jgi:hypothetical protein